MSFSRISAGGILFSVAVVGTGMTAAVQAQQADMTFFVTSVGKGNGADLGGLEGADAHCAALAKAARWRAVIGCLTYTRPPEKRNPSEEGSEWVAAWDARADFPQFATKQ